MKLRYLPLLLPLAVLAEEPPQMYTCDNGSRIEISFSAPDSGRPSATLHFADGRIELPMVPSASGSLYRADPVSLHTKGDEAIFQDGKDNLRRCTRGQAAPVQPPSPAASSFIEVGGSVSYRARIALPPGSILSIRIQGKARPGARARTLVEQRYELDGAQSPIPFAATVDRDLIGKKGQLTATARIDYRGKPYLVSDQSRPLLKDGQPIAADIQLKPVNRPRTR